MSSQLIRALLLALLSTVIALPVGYFVAHWAGWTVFCLGLALQMAFHFRNFARLDRWSHNPVVDASLEGEGAWDGIFGRLYRHEKDLREQIAERDHKIAMLFAAGQALTDGVVLLDTQNQILFCNSTAENQLGLVIRTDRGQSVANIVRQPEFVAYLEAGDFSRPLTMHAERNDDRVFSIHIIPYAGSREWV